MQIIILCLSIFVISELWKPIQKFKLRSLMRKKMGEVITKSEAINLYNRFQRLNKAHRETLPQSFWEFDYYQITSNGVCPVCKACGNTINLPVAYNKHLSAECIKKSSFVWRETVEH